MDILYYNELDYGKVADKFKKVAKFLAKGDFQSADVKKIQQTDYYRARLDRSNRLLFKFAKYENKTYLLLLEVILNHEYEKSKFLRGIAVDENKFQAVDAPEKADAADRHRMLYVNRKNHKFHILDKFISFDEEQDDIYNLPTPLIIIGSAGSGKTILTLEKLKTLNGNVAYISLSPFLVENAQNIYYSHNYDNPNQEIDFLSFNDYLQSFRLPKGTEITYKNFEAWFVKHIQHSKIREPYRLFEEFKGVLTGSVIDKAYITEEEYLELGIKQSIFPANQRAEVYSIFKKYLRFLEETNFYDSNILSYNYLSLVEPKYDFVVVDEVQDITNIQLKLILKSIKSHHNFIFSGDSNQIVHPNFFSWSKVKTMFYKSNLNYSLFKILKTNYRNSEHVIELSNTLLKIKNTRFGSIDKESTYMVNSVSANKGEVVLYEDNNKLKKQLNSKTQKSAKFAVLVMNEQDKAYARRSFKTPLIFSIQEAKGLEYDNIILVNFVSAYQDEFREIAKGVTPDMLNEEMRYARARNKEDKDLEVYKFFINALYVAFTRSVKNIYIIEKTKKHPLYELLGLKDVSNKVQVEAQKSDDEDWLEEAGRLEKQGKFEQAQQIRDRISGVNYISPEDLEILKKEALDPTKTEQEVKRQRKDLYRIAVARKYIDLIEQLADLELHRAVQFMKEVKQARKEYAKNSRLDRTDSLQKYIDQYGVDLRIDEDQMTGLMLACRYGSMKVFDLCIKNGANKILTNNKGLNPLQVALRSVYRSDEPGVQQSNYLKPEHLNKVYPILKTQNIRCLVDNHVIKTGNHSMEYFLVNFLSAVQLSDYVDEPENKGLSMNEFMKFLEQIPGNILPDYRRKRQYVNSILANNEADRMFIYNKKLFKRVARGTYTLNPEMKILQ
jgi:hypothetical protein